jgi:hypothetical protein
LRRFVEPNCLDCHNSTTKTANLALNAIIATDVVQHQESWEKVIRKHSARQLPPARIPKPSEQEFDVTFD